MKMHLGLLFLAGLAMGQKGQRGRPGERGRKGQRGRPGERGRKGAYTPVCYESHCDHPCNRDCTTDHHSPMTCHYTFTTRDQYSDTPGRRADGRKRSVLTYNDILPGPMIVVCEGDTVKVRLKNHVKDGPITNADGSPHETTLHFHGIRQVSVTKEGFGPWSDGVPFVTQCPVDFREHFTYKFFAGRNQTGKDTMNAPPGTYWYHSHVGAQRTNGLQGGLIIKDRKPEYSHAIDNPCKQTLLVQEWYESPTCQVPVSILINGKGRLSHSKEDKNKCVKYDCNDPEKVNNFLRGFHAEFDTVPTECPKDDGYEVFEANPDQNYRFRIVGMIGQNVPMRFTIKLPDEKTHLRFTAIAADSLYIEPIHNLTYLWVSAGERFDIIVNVNNKTAPDVHNETKQDAIIMRFAAFTNNDFPPSSSPDYTTQFCTIAYLKSGAYQTIDKHFRLSEDCADDHFNPDFFDGRFKRVLNIPGKDPENFSGKYRLTDWEDQNKFRYIYPIDMRSKEIINTNNIVTDTKFIEFGGGTTFNGIRTSFPRIPYLLQDPQQKYHSKGGPRCDDDDKPPLPSPPQNYVACNHVIKLPYQEGGWAEIVLINNNARGAAHPIHQHGGWFWIIGEGQYPFDQPIDKTFIQEKYHKNKLQINSTYTTYYNGPNSLPKDVIQVPNNGYVIIRTRTDNPGTWIFHCHIDFHLSIGMGLVIQIGERKDWNIGKLTKNQTCREKPPCPTGGNANVGWFLNMSIDGVERCIVKGKTARFTWNDGAPQVHNVNYLNRLVSDPKQVYNSCNFDQQPLISTTKEDPNKEFIVRKAYNKRFQYFVCGIGDGYHCKHGVKARFYVVDDNNKCHIHPYGTCDDKKI